MTRLSRDMRVWRALYGQTQGQAAEELGVAAKTWQRWESGRSQPDVTNYRRLRQQLAQPPPGWVRPWGQEVMPRG